MERNTKLLAIYIFARIVGKMSTTKGRNLGLRFDEQDTQDLDLFERSTGIEATTLARNATRACLAYWKKHGKISFPLRLVEMTVPLEGEKPFEITRIITEENLQPTAEEKNASVLNEESPAVQRVRGSVARARTKL